MGDKRVQVDELWGFVGAKQKNVATAKRKDTAYGDAWLWVATDADTKLVPSWRVGGRDSDYAMVFMDDLASRLANRIQLTSDGHRAYLEAVEGAFGGDVDYAMLVKITAQHPKARSATARQSASARKKRIEGNPDPNHIRTSYSERNNLNVRMLTRGGLTRLTNAFSKKIENHEHGDGAALSLYYNFVRVHPNPKGQPGDGGRRAEAALGNEGRCGYAGGLGGGRSAADLAELHGQLFNKIKF